MGLIQSLLQTAGPVTVLPLKHFLIGTGWIDLPHSPAIGLQIHKTQFLHIPYFVPNQDTKEGSVGKEFGERGESLVSCPEWLVPVLVRSLFSHLTQQASFLMVCSCSSFSHSFAILFEGTPGCKDTRWLKLPQIAKGLSVRTRGKAGLATWPDLWETLKTQSFDWGKRRLGEKRKRARGVLWHRKELHIAVPHQGTQPVLRVTQAMTTLCRGQRRGKQRPLKSRFGNRLQVPNRSLEEQALTLCVRWVSINRNVRYTT